MAWEVTVAWVATEATDHIVVDGMAIDLADMEVMAEAVDTECTTTIGTGES